MKTHLFEKAVAILNLARDNEYQVLDFGCGKGDFLAWLSGAVSQNSRLIGYDAMDRSIAMAKTRLPDIEFICERFDQALPFPDTAFDIIVTIDTLECIKHKEALLSEFHRVLKPGGRILAMHWDWDTQTYNIRDRDISRKAVQAFSDWQQPWMDEADGQMGRKLWGLFEGSGKFQGSPDALCLIETKYEAGQYGYERAQDISGLGDDGGFDSSDYERFLRELAESVERGEYFYSITSFIYHGWKN